MEENLNNIQMLFCVECCSSSQTDSVYIQRLLKTLYYMNQKRKDSYIYMGGRNSYNSSKVLNSILSKSKKYSGKTVVVYCIDTDTLNVKKDKFLIDIRDFCKGKDYYLILFVKEIENVIWMRKARRNEKIMLSKQIVNNPNFKTLINVDRLCVDNPSNFGESNFMIVIDGFLSRK